MHTIVFIPGLLSDDRVWRYLSDRSTLPIHKADITRDETITAMAKRILDETDSQLVVIGHSLGGRVAIEIANQSPQRTTALVLSNTGHAPRKKGETQKRASRIELGYRSMQQLAKEWIPPMLAPHRIDDKELVADLTDMVLGFSPDTHAQQINALLCRPDAMLTIPSITCPLLLLTGEQDSWSPELQHREIAEQVPSAELHVVDGAGHFLPLEMPEETFRIVSAWLDKIEVGGL